MKKRLVMFFAVAMSVVCIAGSSNYGYYVVYGGNGIWWMFDRIMVAIESAEVMGAYGSDHNAPTGSVTIPSKILYVVEGLNAQGIEFYPKVTSIGYGAFSGFSGLTSVTIPNSVTSIGNDAFRGCSGLTSVTIPNSVKDIGNGAFRGCSGLTSVTIPASVKSIEQAAFLECSGLKSFSVANDNTAYKSVSGLLLTKDGKKLVAVPGRLTSVTIPDGVESIDKVAFCWSSGLTSVTIPDSVTSIEKGAFINCSGLTSVTIGNKVERIEDLTFRGCSGLTSVTIGNSVKSIGDYAFENCSGLTSVTIPDSVTYIASCAFQGCSGLKSVTIGKGVKAIGTQAFHDCTGLKGVYYNGDLAKWNAISFDPSLFSPFEIIGIQGWRITNPLYYAHKLYLNGSLVSGELSFPDGMTYINGAAFEGCCGLTSVTIPSSVTVVKWADNIQYFCPDLKVNITDLAKWCNVSFGSVRDNPFYYTHDLYLNGSLVSDLVIPEGALNIGNYAFTGCTGLTSVTIPDGVKNIGDNAFSGCTGLTSVTIPDGVKNIGDYAFYGCSKLTNVTIPSSVTNIGSNAFSTCSRLKSVTIPQCVCDQGMAVAFPSNYQSIVNVVIADGAKNISSNAFKGCGRLTSLVIPNSITNIESGAFSCCSGLRDVTIPQYVCDREFSSIFSSVYQSIKNVVIADGVTSIGRVAFSDCSGLTSVTIGNDVTSIGWSAFRGCSGLKSLTIGNGVTSIKDYAFEYCTNLTSVTIPDSVKSIGLGAFLGCSGLTSVTIGNGVTSIGGDAFYGCSGLKSITIGNGVKSIGANAFDGCSGLTSVTIPDGVTRIGGAAFYGCDGLTSMTIPNSVTSIGAYVFEHCSGLTSVEIPASVTSIGKEAFGCCTNLTSVTIPDSVKSIGFYAFGGCSGLTSVTIPNSVTNIDDYAFENCSGLTSVTIPQYVCSSGMSRVFGSVSGSITNIVISDGVTSIGNSAFHDCSGLTNVVIPSSVTSIGNSAFSRCFRLTSITIPNSVKSIGQSAFSMCYRLTSIMIPNSVKSIESNAFSGCSGLTNVTIPDGVTSIENGAFYNCSGLEEITLPFVGAHRGGTGRFDSLFGYIFGNSSYTGGMQTRQYYSSSSFTTYYIPSKLKKVVVTDETVLGYGAFYGCSGLTSVTIPASVTQIYGAAFAGCASLMHITLPGWFYETLPGSVFEGCPAGLQKEYNPFKVIFDANGGEGGKSVIQDYGTVLIAPVVTRAGYTFIGWSPSVEATVPASNVTYTAQWKVNQYEVTFDANGGVGGTSMTLDYGAAIVAPTVTREGYTFAGWLPSVPATVPAANVTYNAQWRINQYTVTFDANGGTGGSAGCGTLTTNAWALLSRDSDGTEEYRSPSIGNSASTYMLLTITGPCDLTFSWNVSSEGGYDYLRWYLDGTEKAKISGTGGTWRDVSVSVPSGEHTVKWSYSKNGSTASGSDCGWVRVPKITPPLSLDYGQAVGELPTPTRTGHSFAGWWTSASGGTQISDSTVVMGDVTYYAHWTVNRYTVTFEANGGTGGKTVTQDYGTALSAPKVTRTGYTLDGWSPTVPATVPASNATYVAQWTKNKYTVTFNANGGSGGWSKSMDYGATITAPTVTREGYTFTGWSPAVPAKVPVGGATYTAQWKINQYTMTFNANGGAGGKTVTQNYGTVLFAPTVTRTGYTFTGWLPGVPATVPAANVTYTAQWQLNPHTVTFDANGGTMAGCGTLTTNAWTLLSRDSDGTEEYRSPSIGNSASTYMLLTITGPCDLTFSWKVSSEGGYDSLRWYLDGTEKARISGTDIPWQDVSVSVPAGEHTVKWSYSKDHSIARGSDCGWVRVPKVSDSVSLNHGQVDHGQAFGELPTPTRTGYTFKGWFTAASGDTQISASTVVTGDVTYYAHWTVNQYTVTFDVNGGTGGKTVTQDYGTALSAPTVTRTGYAFAGWWTAESGGVKITADTVVTEDATYYARWTANKYNVKFYADGGKGTMMTLSATYGTSVRLTANAFKRTGYKFAGWAKSKGGAVAYKDRASVKDLTSVNGKTVALYAVWKPCSYKIKFDKNGGKGTMKTLSATYGKDVKLTANAFKRTGYKFAGWAKKKNGKVAYKNKAKVKNLTATNGKTVTLYAVWNKAKSGDVKAAAAKPAAAAAVVPAWAVGTFYGGDEGAFTTITVSRAGKVSGKVLFADGKWTIVGKASGQRIAAVVTDADGNSAEIVFAIVKTPDGRCRIESEDGLISAEN